MINLSDSDLTNKIVSGDKFVVIFYAFWHGPSINLINDLRSDNFENLYCVDIDSNPINTVKYRISDTPTSIAFSNGEIEDIVSHKEFESVEQYTGIILNLLRALAILE